MEKRMAGRVATEAARFYANHPDRDDRPANMVNTGIGRTLAHFVPNDAVVAVLEWPEGEPLVLAATATHLYAVDVPNLPGEADSAAKVRCRLFRLDPEVCHVEVENQYDGGSFTFGDGIRRTRWKFQVEDLAFEFSTRTHLDGEVEPRDGLGQHVAAVLGWQFGRPDEEQHLREVA